ncbi:MAG: hypothetical protein LBC39_06370 [Methanobrevibacter sp.]|nr:hypothetical protein [Candidatus Methanovirga aequatorialis]
MVEDLLGLNSASNIVYSDRTIVCHLLMPVIPKLVLITLVIFVLTLSEGTIRHRLCNLDLNEVQEDLNDRMKIHAAKTVPKKLNTFAIDFVNIPYYGKEKKQWRYH